jgi:hypothetical protein
MEFEVEMTDDPLVAVIETNLLLAVDGAETYDSAESLFEGSPVAQALAGIPGILQMVIEEHAMTITRDDDIEWYAIVEDVSASLKDFFL